MSTNQQREPKEIQADIDTLERKTYLVATNAGTYGAAEACRMVGSGDPQIATRNVYETVAGIRSEHGPDESVAPGRMRRINAEALRADRARLVALRDEQRQLTRSIVGQV